MFFSNSAKRSPKSIISLIFLDLSGLAGLPTTMVLGRTFSFTTALGQTTEFSSILTPGHIIAPGPT